VLRKDRTVAIENVSPQDPPLGDRGVITLAFGKRKYLDMATNLARSIKLNWPGTMTAIVTDSSDPRLAAVFDHVLRLKPEYGDGLKQKLSLQHYTPFRRTLYLDSDCLVVRPMPDVWETFQGRPLAVVGDNVESGEWFGADLSEVRRNLNIDQSIPKFNSGLVYWETSCAAGAVFDDAISLASQYAILGFKSFRQGLPEADEPLLALAMGLHGLKAMDDSGSIMRTMLELEGPLRVDSLQGISSFVKAGQWVSPAVVHFCGPHAIGPVYRREAFKLWMASNVLSRRRGRRGIACVVNTLAAPFVLFDRGATWKLLRALRATYMRFRAERAT
jgi:hypothetical protein